MENNQTQGESNESKKKNKKKFKERANSFWKEFKAFMSKGNVLNLAVAFVMGTAFTKIVNSSVNDLIMPLFSAIFGKADLSNYKWVINDDLVISWGSFVLAVIEFLIISFFLFMLIRTITKAKTQVSGLSKKTLKALKKGKITEEQAKQTLEAETQKTTPPPIIPVDTTESLLKEIRDLLKEQASKKDEAQN